MATEYNYASAVTITITNAIDTACCKYKACDAGTPKQRVIVAYKTIKDKPGVKFDYLFTDEGEFLKVKDLDTTIKAEVTKDTTVTDEDYVVVSYQKFKNTDRKIPAYRTFNGKVLKPGDSVKFVTENKDEVVFYEKVVEAFGSKCTTAGEYTGGELTMKVEAASA